MVDTQIRDRGVRHARVLDATRRVPRHEFVPADQQPSAYADRLGYTNIHTRHGDGYRGWPEAAPFHKIIVTAAPEEVPQALVDQLAVGGIMVVPVGRDGQMMTIIRKTKNGVVKQETIPVLFVPMIKK